MGKEQNRDDAPPKTFLARLPDDQAECRLQADLDRAFMDKVMASADRGSALARDLESSAALGLPTFSDVEEKLKDVVAVANTPPPEDLLELDRLGDLTVEGVRLNELLSRGDASIEERKVLKSGLLFMRRKRYGEAAEWWSLNRPKEQTSNRRFYCLVTLLLALTYELRGDADRARAAKAEALRLWGAIAK